MQPLPNELIAHCISFVDTKDKETCLAVCATSQLCREFGNAVLYQDVGWREDEVHGEELCRRLRLLSRALSNAHLARHVRHFRYAFNRKIEPFEYARGDSIAPYLNDMIQAARYESENIDDYAKLLDEWADEWVEDRKRPWEPDPRGPDFDDPFKQEEMANIYAGLILSRCPNLDCLEFRGDVSKLFDLGHLAFCLELREDDGWSVEDDDACKSGKVLPALDLAAGLMNAREVRLLHTTPCWSRDFCFATIMTVLCLNVTELFISGLQPHSRDQRYPQVCEYGDVTDLTLTDCSVEATDIEDIFLWCPELESLRVEWGSGRDIEPEWDVIGDAMREHGKYLKRITMIVPEHYSPSASTLVEPHSAYVEGLGCLRGLVALEYLEAPERAIFGEWTVRGIVDCFDRTTTQVVPGTSGLGIWLINNALPESLIELHIRSDGLFTNRVEEERLLTDPQVAEIRKIVFNSCAGGRSWVHDNEK